MEERGEWEGLWGLKVADGWAFGVDETILIQYQSRSQAKNPCSVSKSKPSKEFKSGVWIEEGVAGVVGGGGGAEEVIESEDEIKVIEDVDELEVEMEVDVSVGLGVGSSGIFGGFPRGSVLGGGLIFDGVGGEDASPVVGAELGEF